MARHEADREDLMNEATALERRIELALPDEPENVIAGMRKSGNLSIYFGPDPVYHFDAENRLRRAFVGGFLFRTQGETLARLRRLRTESASELHRYDLDPQECDEFLAEAHGRLLGLCTALAEQRAQIVQHIPADDREFVSDLSVRIVRLLSEPLVPAPAIPGKH